MFYCSAGTKERKKSWRNDKKETEFSEIIKRIIMRTSRKEKKGTEQEYWRNENK